jgi:hypothetical protein
MAGDNPVKIEEKIVNIQKGLEQLKGEVLQLRIQLSEIGKYLTFISRM